MALLTSFCGLLTLQVGAAVLASIFFTLAAVILAANIFDYHNSTDGWPANLILMIIFVLGLIFIGVLMFAASYSERRQFALIAVMGIVILLCYWIILCCFSFFSTPSHVRTVCIAILRCPESLWIANLGYRGSNETSSPKKNNNKTSELSRKRYVRSPFFHVEHEMPLVILEAPGQHNHSDTWKNSTDEGTAVRRKRYSRADVLGYEEFDEPMYLKVKKYLELNLLPLTDVTRIRVLTDSHSYEDLEDASTFKKVFIDHSRTPVFKMYFRLNETKEDEDEAISHIKYGFPFIGALILFVANLLFFIFAALIMWSWASELDWADYYVEDEPVVVYEEEYP